MEIKINRDIRKYTESMFLGLSLRQSVFSVLAAAAAAVCWFSFKERAGQELAGWMCILAAAPFAVLGFLNYHGMSAEKLLVTWLRSSVLCPKRIGHKGCSIYGKILSDLMDREKRAERKRD